MNSVATASTCSYSLYCGFVYFFIDFVTQVSGISYYNNHTVTILTHALKHQKRLLPNADVLSAHVIEHIVECLA